MESEFILRLSGVSKSISGKKIIDNISFDVKKGEVFGLLGPNGAGKTTTIRMITGLNKIDSGSIYINGYNIKTNFCSAMESIGSLVEAPYHYTYLSGYRNLSMAARMYKDVTKERIDEVVEMIGLKDRIYDKVSKYSLGMKQRLGIGIALVHKPKVIILDEPTNGLDPQGIKEIREYLKKVAHNDGISVLVSSHLLSEMELLCDRYFIMKDGRKIDIKSSSDYKNELNNGYIISLVDNNLLDKANALLKQHNYTGKIENNKLLVKVKEDKMPETLEILRRYDIKTTTVEKRKISLEDYFLNVIGE